MPSATRGSSALVTSSQMMSLRLGGERTGNADALLLAAGQFGWVAVREALSHFDLIEKLRQATFLFRTSHTEIELERPTDDVTHCLARVHGDIGHLIDHLQLAQIIARALGQRRRKVAAGEMHLALVGRQQAGNHAGERRFSRPGFPHHGQRLSGVTAGARRS